MSKRMSVHAVVCSYVRLSIPKPSLHYLQCMVNFGDAAVKLVIWSMTSNTLDVFYYLCTYIVDSYVFSDQTFAY